jgi:hypothetical protein
MTDKAKRLLDLAIDEATLRLKDYNPSDLNALIKALSDSTKDKEKTEVQPVKKLSGFISSNLTVNK